MRKKDYLILIISWIFFIAFDCALILLGIEYSNEKDLFWILGVSSLSIYILLFAISIVYKKRKKKIADNTSTIDNYVKLERQKILDNPDSYFKRIVRINNIGIIYLFFLVLLIYPAFLLLGTTKDEGVIFVLSIVILCFQLIPIHMFFHSKNNVYPNILLTKTKHPKIADMIEKALAISELKMNINSLKIHLFTGYDISVYYDRVYHLNLGINALRTLSNDEIIAILLHEFGHIKSNDLRISTMLYKSDIHWQNLTKIPFLRTFLIFFGFNVGMMEKTYLETISYKKEVEADLFVKEKGYAQYLANALAKMQMITFCNSELPIKNIYADNVNFPNLPRVYFENLLEAYEKKSNVWKIMAEKELKHNENTHPSFSERIKMLECNYEILFSDITPELIIEINRISDSFTAGWKEQWKEQRTYDYIWNLEVINDYEKDNNVNDYEIINIILYYFNLCEYEKAKELSEKLLVSEPDNAVNLSIYGKILLNEYNEDGLIYLKKACDLSTIAFYNDSNFLLIYCSNHGLQDKFDELEKWQLERSNILLEREKHRVRHKRIELFDPKISNETRNILKDKIEKLNINECYLGRLKLSKDEFSFVFSYYQKDNLSEKEKYILYNNINSVLTSILGYDYIIDNSLGFRLSRIKNCLIFYKTNLTDIYSI